METTPPVFRADLVHSSVYIAPGAVVVGDVAIAADSSVWFSAVIRGDCAPIRIGRGSNIQDAAVLHADPGFPTTIGDGVTVGHGAIVHGATIEDNVVVGMKSVVQNGARVGANSIIAVGCVIPEGVQIPPGSLVMGLPGKIKRPLEPHEVEMNGYSAQHYVENGKHFAQAGQLLRGTASGA
ncbi:MAG: gamma carbonic anhydrase family protein [Pirellulales bacterium]|nr:gamma carbonic anhydrase family protein [Pirellulales bacterium]